MSISKSEWYSSYERKVYSILDYLGDFGGIYEILVTLEYIIVTIFTSTSFHYSILPEIYQVDTLGCQIDHESNEKRRITQSMQQSMSLNRTQNEESKHCNSITEHQFEVNRENENENELIKKAHKNMQNRKSYNYTFTDTLYNVW